MSTTQKKNSAAGKFQRLPTIDQLIVKNNFVHRAVGNEYSGLGQRKVPRSLKELSADLARNNATTARPKSHAMAVKVETREDRIARIRQSLAGKLPTISVQVTQPHLGPSVLTPAAETELRTILKECGFAVVEENSKQKPDIRIIGEACRDYTRKPEPARQSVRV